jgi:hypothetical protein
MASHPRITPSGDFYTFTQKTAFLRFCDDFPTACEKSGVSILAS